MAQRTSRIIDSCGPDLDHAFYTSFTEHEVIHQTGERLFYQDIQTPRSGLRNEAQPHFFNRLRGVWIPDETLF